MIKRILSVLIILTLLPTVFVFAQALEKDYEDAPGKLLAFGVYEPDDLKKSGETTRGDFVRYVVKMCGLEELSCGTEAPYEDLRTTDAVSKYVNVAYEYGYINFWNGQTFGEDKSITYNEAIKILIYALGYELIAERGGKNISSYIVMADKIGLTKNIVPTKILTPELTAKLLYNAMQVQVPLVQNRKDYVMFNLKTGDTLLSQRHQIFWQKGLVTANSYTSIYAPKGCGNGGIMIDNEYFFIADEALYSYIGKEVEIFYRKDKNMLNKTLVYINETKKVNSFTVNGDDVTQTSVKQLTFSEEGKKKDKTVYFDTKATLIYNGKQAELKAERLKPLNGTVELTDNNSDELIDIIKVNDYNSYVISAISDVNKKFHDLISDSYIEADSGSSKYDLLILKDGDIIPFADLHVGDVISETVSLDNDKPLRTFYVSSNSAECMLTAVEESDATYFELENGLIYKYTGKQDITSGIDGEFYIDVLGNIVHCVEGDKIVYGYLTGMQKEGSIGAVKAKIFTENDRIVTLDFAEKIKHQNSLGVTSFVTAEQLLSSSDFVNGDGSFKKQLVTYRVNKAKQIRVFNTAAVVSSTDRWSDAEKSLIEQDIFRRTASLTDSKYWNTGGTTAFSNDFALHENTRVFVIPSNNESEFKIIKNIDIKNDENYNVDAYNVSEYGVAEAVVIKESIVNESATMYVNKVVKTVGYEGEESVAIVGIVGGSERKLIARNKDVEGATTVASGDIIEYGTDTDGYLVTTKSLFSYQGTDTSSYGTKGGSVNSSKLLLVGEIRGIDVKNTKVVIYYASKTGVFNCSKVADSLYVYYKDKQKYVKGDLSDIEPGDRVFIQAGYTSISKMVVMK